MALPGRRILILYGSEMGASQEKAEEIDRICQRLRFHTELEEMNDVKLNDLLVEHSLVIFVISTTGQGQFPANSQLFWKSLRRAKLPPNCLSTVQFTTFGLGDSSYSKFNWASRLLNSRLLRLGAQEVVPRGEGDERHDDGIDSIYQPWIQSLKDYFFSQLPLPAHIDPIPDSEPLPPRYSLEIVSQNGDAALSRDKSGKQSDGISSSLSDGHGNEAGHGNHTSLSTDFPPALCLPIPNGCEATVASIARVTPSDHWQDVRLLQLEVEVPLFDGQPSPAPLSPGDTVVLYPKNYPEDVQVLIDIMGWGSVADKEVTFGKLPKSFYPAPKSTLRDLFTHNFDFNAVPNRTFLEKLSQFTTNEDQKEKLLELVQPSSTQEFYDFTSRPRRTILEVLAEFHSAKVPYQYISDLFPVIRGREYSIANGGDKHLARTESLGPDDTRRKQTRTGAKVGQEKPTVYERVGTLYQTIDVLIAIVEYRTIIRKPRQGLLSRYAKNLPAGTRIVVKLHQSSTPLPADAASSSRPLLAIATGTGIAPIRSLIQSRSQWQDAGKTLLFFGCRNEKADYYFHDEWDRIQKLSVIPVFSREAERTNELAARKLRILDKQVLDVNTTDSDSSKTYVQHLIRRKARAVCKLFAEKPIICICGNSGRMPVAVREALRDAAVLGGLCADEVEATKLFEEGNPNGLVIWQETW